MKQNEKSCNGRNFNNTEKILKGMKSNLTGQNNLQVP